MDDLDGTQYVCQALVCAEARFNPILASFIDHSLPPSPQSPLFVKCPSLIARRPSTPRDITFNLPEMPRYSPGISSLGSALRPSAELVDRKGEVNDSGIKLTIEVLVVAEGEKMICLT